MKIKAGILTFYYAYNFGAVLQAYALRRYLRNKGVDAEIVPYVSDYDFRGYSINPFASKSGRRDQLRKIRDFWKNYKRTRVFTEFQKKDLNVNDRKVNWEEYDVLIVGSDQVWNPDITGGDTVYLGSSACENQRLISYAASFGKGKIPSEQIDIFRKYLSKFDLLTVREESGADILKDLGLSGQRICDPVFLLDHREWSEHLQAVNAVKDKKYIFLYILEYNQDLINQVYERAGKENLCIFAAHPTGNRWGLDIPFVYNCSPWQFLYLIENADYVATNSFHAMSFSLIFRKDIIYVPHKTRGTRTEELFSMVNCIYENSDRDYAALEEFILRSRSLLDTTLNI